jgi:uncharacterized protein YndB with AHSA1/START domain
VSETKSIVVERLMPHPPARIWRALVVPELVEQWLMKNDFAPVVGHRFTFSARPVPGWSGVTYCEVVTVEEPRLLVYRWGNGTESDSGLQTVVTWTLTEQDGGTLVRMEHSGFRPQDEAGYKGMGSGWPGILARLDSVAAHSA